MLADDLPPLGPQPIGGDVVVRGRLVAPAAALRGLRQRAVGPPPPGSRGGGVFSCPRHRPYAAPQSVLAGGGRLCPPSPRSRGGLGAPLGGGQPPAGACPPILR